MFKLTGWILICISLFTMGNFIFTGAFANYWSHIWVSSIVFSILPAGIGSFFLSNASARHRDVAIKLFGSIYTVCGILLYGFMSFSIVGSSLDVPSFFGIFGMFVLASGVGLFSLSQFDSLIRDMPGYGFGFLSVLLLVAIVLKHTIYGIKVETWDVVGECFVFIVGSGIFVFQNVVPSRQ